jgi:hypothetical protein
MHVFDTIWLYDPDDRQYEAQVREINTRAIGIKSGRAKVDSQIFATIMRPVYNGGDRRVEIRNDELLREGWDWSTRPVPPIRKGALVVIKNWDRLLEAKVYGLIASQLGSAHSDYFAFEGVRALPRGDKYSSGSDLGKIKGHRFTASTECVEKIIKNGKGRRLLLGPYMTEAENRKFFKDLYS